MLPILLLAFVIIGVAQVWSKPNFFAGKYTVAGGLFEYDTRRHRWTFLILWVALALTVAYFVAPLFL